MDDPELRTFVKTFRELAGLSQQLLAERVGISRQSLSAIESGRQSPSTTLALKLAAVLDCEVEDLFALNHQGQIEVDLIELEATDPLGPDSFRGGRVNVAKIDERYVAHHLRDGSAKGADAILTPPAPSSHKISCQLLRPIPDIDAHILISGCAPLFGIVAEHANRRLRRGRMTWLPQNTERALQLLGDTQVHAAGIHQPDQDNEKFEEFLAQQLPTFDLQIVNLARWRQGILVQHNHQGGIHELADLHRPGLRIARREAGSEASRLLNSGGDPFTSCVQGPLVTSHEQVAQLIACGAADAGIAIESMAIAYGLKFIPLSEERFDIILRREEHYDRSTQHLLSTLAERSYRDEAASLPGYDLSLSGESKFIETGS